MGAVLEILKGIMDATEEEKKKENDKKEKEMDSYNLDEWQKERVRKGLNDPWDFEEEDLEEGDYYEDDD